MLKILVVVFAIVFLASCSNKNDLAVIDSLNDELMRSTYIIDNHTYSQLRNLVNDTSEPISMQQTLIWLPKAQLVERLSSNLFTYIEAIKADIKKDMNSKVADNLFEKCNTYIKKMLAIDTDISKQFNDDILAIDSMLQFNTQVKKTSIEGSLILLAKLQNRIAIVEYSVVEYCNMRVSTTDDGYYESYSLVCNQNAKYLKAGEEIEINTGVAEFSRKAKPQVYINRKVITRDNYDGSFTYKAKVAGSLGKHTIPIKIVFRDRAGKMETVTKDVEYYIEN